MRLLHTIIIALLCVPYMNAQEVLLEDLFRSGRFYFYKDSAFTGKAVEYFEDKKPKRERNFKKGLANGSEFIWYSNGRLKEEKNYLNVILFFY